MGMWSGWILVLGAVVVYLHNQSGQGEWVIPGLDGRMSPLVLLVLGVLSLFREVGRRSRLRRESQRSE